ncbi:hypothetical protein EUTSA_v10000306mg [Eutrema salsugineum]|uniref:Uncharacterized protein n=1 Tax=Eutrema salsugineum TaxID=72664 RepID=V4L769_EUTSA|nr:hypothetical protein EUTSA_v10000306mg [Eutrema salsugineum]
MSLTIQFLLLLLLVLRSHHVDSGSIVKYLPGFEGPLPFELETGYIGIGEEEEVQLFYYFIKSEKNQKEDPLLIWLSGGSGCSSLHGLLFENGPVAMKSEVYENARYYLYYLIECWANNERVREALHVQKRCNKTIPYNYDIVSSVPCHMNNSISGYRSLIYSGDHDITMPFQATKAWIKSLNYPIIDDWRPWMIKDQIAGYTRTYANKMTFATIKGGGHTAEYTPNETFIIFQRWISGQPL